MSSSAIPEFIRWIGVTSGGNLFRATLTSQPFMG
jgi:hypothetical protein